MGFSWCSYFNYMFLSYCFPQDSVDDFKIISDNSRFQVQYQWSHLNYTWESPEHYRWAIESKRYIPENNAPVGMKFYKHFMFLSVPRFREGVPATLVNFDTHQWLGAESPLLSPFPDWPSNNDVISCSNLQSVQSMEIDTKGVLWVIDGVRLNNYTRCPTKLVLYDLENGGQRIHTHIFPREICLQDGGFLNDLVIDNTDGGFAYITDNSAIDPGIIVFSRFKGRSWKLRDVSMFPEPFGTNFPIEDIIFDTAGPVDGIALSPARQNGEKILYFCVLTGFKLYSITTGIIKNEQLVKSGNWRTSVKNVGQKISQSDGIIMDENANLFFTLLQHYGVAKWNSNRPFWTSQVIDQNRRTMIWPDGFAFDQNGYLFVIANKVFNYIDPRKRPERKGGIQFRISRIYTGTRSYLYG